MVGSNRITVAIGAQLLLPVEVLAEGGDNHQRPLATRLVYWGKGYILMLLEDTGRGYSYYVLVPKL